jgi:hypothetical protein
MIDPKLVINTVKNNAMYLESHYKTIDILEGNLEPYVKANLREQFSDRVYKYAVQRMVPINVLPRYVEKLANRRDQAGFKRRSKRHRSAFLVRNTNEV